ncbi:EscU/YscU/HrcU family type III secretion system export apparatus switch protein [Sphingomonas adhaesiva]|uniref:EscU/YscU/HrcU family type III secretion system export apparatus switch protein n=1 Tax=Sphingomonas adhaesiva TaxID=28212 RepID=UPI002FF5A061
MAEASGEQDRSEDATPFKLDRARRKGMLARGTDLGFVSVLIAAAVAAQTTGQDLIATLRRAMRHQLLAPVAYAGDVDALRQMIARPAIAIAATLALPALILLAIAITNELIQNRGMVFTAEPLKPDVTRLNPATGLKRVLSMRMMKELGKNLAKLVLYAGAATIFLLGTAYQAGRGVRSARDLADVLVDVSGRLLLLFLLLAAAVALADQILARRTFAKDMRMSRRDVRREVREREGEPRQKQKRRQILEDILKKAAGAVDVKGADVVIVNPTHYAVALRYRAGDGDAPIVQARGRNLWAQRMREAARREGITIVRHPTLARALYHFSPVGRPIREREFVAVADIYIMLRRAMRNAGQQTRRPSDRRT